MANVTLLQPSPGMASPTLLIDLALEPLDLAPQVRDDAGVLGNVVGDTEQVLLYLRGARDGAGRVQSPQVLGSAAGSSLLFLPAPPGLSG